MKRCLATMAAALCASCAATATTTPPRAVSVPPATSASPAAPPPSPSPSCDAQLWAHVYHPDRLKVITQCRTVTGTIEAVRYEDDGDTHEDLRVTDPSLLNPANLKYQHGDLVLEQICQGKVTQADAIQACQGVPHQPIPKVGDHVTVTGTYVLDQNHGWTEIHPVTTITETP